MKAILSFVASCGLAVCSTNLAAQQQQLETEQAKVSYMIGLNVGNSLKSSGAEFDLDAMMLAIDHALKGEEPLLNAEEIAALQAEFGQQMQQRQQAQAQVQAESNIAKGEEFLAENKSKEGVQVTDSGLQYQVIKDATGDKPKASDTVTVHYRGTLIDGTEFDSSYGRGEPATFPLNRVIPGWTEALQLMPVGSTYRFFIPSQLAYGERGAGQLIGPHATLIFDVELLSIQ